MTETDNKSKKSQKTVHTFTFVFVNYFKLRSEKEVLLNDLRKNFYHHHLLFLQFHLDYLIEFYGYGIH